MDSRREFLKKALYVTPVIVTASVRPAFARNTYGGGAGIGGTPQGEHGGGSSTWVEKLVDQIKEI